MWPVPWLKLWDENKNPERVTISHMVYVVSIVWGFVRWAIGLFFGWLMGAVSLWLLTFVLHFSASSIFYLIVALCVFAGTAFLGARSLDFRNTVSWKFDCVIALIVFVCGAIALYWFSLPLA